MVYEVWKPGDTRSNKQVSDEDLVDRFQAGDDSAFNELFDRYNLRLCNYLANLTGSPDTGRELAHSVFVKVCNQTPRDINNFKAWLYRVGYNSAMDHWRDKKRFISWENCPEDTVYIEAPDRQIEQAELINIAMKSIPKKYRAPIYLYYVEDMGQAEIALSLHSSERSVRRHIKEGMEKLRLAYEYLRSDSDISRRGGPSHG